MSRLTIRARLIILSGALAVHAGRHQSISDEQACKQYSTAVATETELSGIIDSANGARIAFGEMRYWLTDLAVSLLTPSERNANGRPRPHGRVSRPARAAEAQASGGGPRRAR